MNKLSRISQYIFAYGAWVIFIMLFLAILLLGRDTWLAALRNYWAQDHFGRQSAINFLDRAFVLAVGITWLILMLVTESYFRNGIVKGDLTHRISAVIGVEVLVIFFIHLAMTLMMGFAAQTPLRWALLGVEFVIGAGLIVISRVTAKKKKTRKVESI